MVQKNKIYEIHKRMCDLFKEVCLSKTDIYKSVRDGFATTYHMGCPRGVMVKAMDCGIVVREFVLQSRYYIHIRANTLGKGMNPLILPAVG